MMEAFKLQVLDGADIPKFVDERYRTALRQLAERLKTCQVVGRSQFRTILALNDISPDSP
jgi:hypothetical protein